MKNILRILFTPSCWLRNKPTHKEWDEAVNTFLDTGRIVLISRCKVVVDGIAIWVGNYPYGYGSLYNEFLYDEGTWLPSRKTVFRLHDVIEAQREKDFIEKLEGL